MQSSSTPACRWRWSWLCLWLVLVGCALGCARETAHAVIVVSTTGLAPEVVELGVEVLLDGRAANESYSLSSEQAVFSAQLPDGAHGAALVRIRGLDAQGCVRSLGQAGVQVDGIGRYELGVPLTPLAAPSCETTIAVTLSGRRGELRLTEVTAWRDGALLLSRETHPAAQGTIELSLGAIASGTIRVDVTGLGCQGCVLLHGVAELRLERYGRHTLPVDLTSVLPAMCPPAVSQMLVPRQGHGALLLRSGRNAGSVLLLAGDNGAGVAHDSVELYDPRSGRSRQLGSLLERRDQHRTVLFTAGPLRGKVMLIGGYIVGQYLKSVELYDPETETSRPLPPLSDAVNGHSATLLPDGRVVVIGGKYQATERRTVEVFDPASETWSLADSAPVGVYLHTATLLGSGRVLVAGGYIQQSTIQSDTAALLDLSAPRGRQWTEVARLSSARYHHQAAALADGRALILGGFGVGLVELSSTEVFDPATLRFQAGAPLFYRRGSQGLSVLSGGSLYLAGGVNAFLSAAYATAEIYDPALGRSLPSAGLQKKRGALAVTGLPDDGVLLSGGYLEPPASPGSVQVTDAIELVYPLGCTP